MSISVRCGRVCFLFILLLLSWLSTQLDWTRLGWMLTLKENIYSVLSQQEGIHRNEETNYSNIGVC